MAPSTPSPAVLFTVLVLTSAGAYSSELGTKYPFNRVLFDDGEQFYEMYWNFSIAAGTIHFAVNASTTGWVGFGVSPNGQMPGSDVVIGWIDTDGNKYFHDRYADGRSLPSIDPSQDWFLIAGNELNGFTTLEFTRKLTNCDSRDLDIKADTSHIVWSFSNNDPTDPLGATAQFHDYQGSVSLDLLGGLTNPPKEEEDLEFFDLTVSNVTIPADDTTYWCHSIKLPENVQNSTKYITKFAPVHTPHSRSFVHHILVYQCTSPLNDSLVGESVPCDQSSPDIANCRARGGYTVAVWSIGGQDFVYPDNVGFPIGGAGEVPNMVIEMHYDNPRGQENVTDSSGIRFSYVSEPREHDAGVLYLGHSVFPTMIIPPGVDNYTISGVCGAQCTERYLPQNGINIFANLLHTHLVGRGLVLQHIRWNPDCSVYEELPPIDINLSYDSDYQQTTHLSRVVTVLPGDILILKCFYETRNIPVPTIAGESTREEMCLAFPLYYPRFRNERNLDYCVSFPTFPTAFTPFQEKYAASNPMAARLWNVTGVDSESIGSFVRGFYAVNWTPEAKEDFQNTILSGPTGTYCASVASDDPDTFVNDFLPGPPQVNCSYEAPDQCSGFEPLPCCERLSANSAPNMMWPRFQIIGVFGLVAALLARCLQ